VRRAYIGAARGLKNKKRCTRVCVEWQLRAVEGDVDMVMVNDAILSAATELGIIDEVQAYLENGVEDGREITERLLYCFNTIENELALDYFPLKTEVEVETEMGVVHFSGLDKKVVRILKVEDEWGNDVPFKIFPEYIKTQISGKVKMTYAYIPNKKELGEQSDFTLYASTRLFSYGMAAQYTLQNGSFEENAIWEKKYKDAIKRTYRLYEGKVIRSRRWV
jgi:hypothetical protein